MIANRIMKWKIKVLINAFFCFSMILLVFLCCESEQIITPPEPKDLELVFPKGGETFNADEIVPIVYSYNPEELVLVDFFISFNKGKDWEEILELTLRTSTNEIDTFVWNLAQTNVAVVGKEFLLKIHDYGGNNFDVTDEVITVKKP